ncbi:RNA-binding S4 domain-containing protein [Thalassotalea nanhaiensis]|uniref:RNA-binding S4 domain-containing protein n=1 Tax=Thalassotalea nanhaiensis TaxID=3065648 RepID=A0ABY9TET2_9GAMM|nr:RNA-binding S4 domain-containing protein [Colwelliaceae bacterium SQ345]
MEIEVLAIELHEEPIELCKLLKIANLVGGGGEAKMVITEGYVYLNGEVEYQKRKKVYFEDIVQFNDEAIMPILSDEPKPVAEPKPNSVTNKAKKPSKNSSSKKSKAKNSPKNKSQKAEKKPSSNNSRTGRKSISF